MFSKILVLLLDPYTGIAKTGRVSETDVVPFLRASLTFMGIVRLQRFSG